MPAGRPSGPSQGNKSQLIRDYYASNPDASVKDCIESLAKIHNIDVSAPLVSGVRRNIGMAPGNKRKGRGRSGEVTGEEIVDLKKKISDLEITCEKLDEILETLEEMGSIQRIREVITTLHQIESSTAIEDEEEEEVEEISDSSENEDEDEDEDEDEEEEEEEEDDE
jgi:phosphopantothenoylcysteine synthetase/decarboxylase